MEDCCTQILGELAVGVDLLSDYKSGYLLSGALLLKSGLLFIDFETRTLNYIL